MHRLGERRRYIRNPEAHRKAVKDYYKRNPEKRRIRDAARKRQVRKSTPKWAKRGIIANELRKIYANCPKNMVVDHIIPIKNKKVCGLHVPWNLRYLDPIENIRKSNKF